MNVQRQHWSCPRPVTAKWSGSLADKGLQVTPYSLVSLPQLLTPLAHGLKEENGGGLRDIQGIHLAGHGDADGKRTVPDWTHTSVLGTYDQRTGET